MSAFVVSNDRSDGTPNVPDASANGKWRPYLWRRSNEQGSGSSISVYLWDETIETPDSVYQKWVPIGNFISATDLTALQAGSTKISKTTSGGNVYFDVVESNIPITGLSGVATASQLPTNIVYNDATNTFSQPATFSSTLTGTLTGNSDTTTKLSSGKDITLTGDATGSVTGVDFSQNVTINTTVTHQAVGSSSPHWNAGDLMGRVIGNQVPTNGDVYTWNSTTNQWEPTPSVSTALNGLSDVVISNIQNDNIIRYNSSSSRFENADITTDTVAEGSSNLYYTEARWDTRLGTKTTDDVAEGTTNIYYTDTRWDTRLTAKSTDNLTEGSSNLYFTDERVDDRLSSLLSDGDGITGSYNDTGNSYSISVDIKPNSGLDFDTAQLKVDMGDFSTSDLSEGTNLYYTDARWDTRLGTKSTSDLSEGTNLYYTDARWDTRLGTKTTDNLTEGSSNLYYTDARWDTRLGTKTTDSLSEGSSNLYYTDARWDTRLGTKDTGDLAEGVNLYYTDARWDTRLGTKNTDDLTEGSTNLYHTSARAQASLTSSSNSNGVVLQSYDNSNGQFSTTDLDTRFHPKGGSSTENFVANNLTVHGTTLTKDTQQVNIGDNIMLLNAEEAGSPTENAGIEVERGTGTNITLRWNETTDKWEFTNDGSAYNPLATDTDDLSEGSSNLYYTDARWDTRLSAKTTDDVTEGSSNLYYTDSRWDTRLGAKTSDDLTEGSTNLYHTDARAISAVTGSSLNMGSNDITTTGKILFSNVYTAEANLPSAATYHGMFAHVHGTGKAYFAHASNWHKLLDETSSDTDDLTEGSGNLYYTDARWDTRLGTKTTDNLTEGSSNLYYTDARWDTRLGAKTTDNLTEGSSNLYYTDARWDTRLGTKNTDNLTEGSTNLYHTSTRVDARIGAASVGDLSDVDLSGLSHQQTLVYNSSTGNFEPGSSGGGGGGGGGHTIQDEGTDVSTVRSNLNFVGELVGAADDGTDSTDVTINAKTVWLYAS